MMYRMILTTFALGSVLLAAHGLADEIAAEPPADPVPAAASADELPQGAGREAVMSSCLGACHQRGILNQPFSPQEWQQCVDDMIALGAPITEENYAPIILYLAQHFGPK